MVYKVETKFKGMPSVEGKAAPETRRGDLPNQAVGHTRLQVQ